MLQLRVTENYCKYLLLTSAANRNIYFNTKYLCLDNLKVISMNTVYILAAIKRFPNNV